MSSNPFEAVAAAAAGTSHNNNTSNNNLRTSGSDISSLSSSTTDLPSSIALTDTLAAANSSTVDISRHPSGIVPILQYLIHIN